MEKIGPADFFEHEKKIYIHEKYGIVVFEAIKIVLELKKPYFWNYLEGNIRIYVFGYNLHMQNVLENFVTVRL